MASKREQAKSKKSSARVWAEKMDKSGFQPTSIKLPDNVGFYKLEIGSHEVDIIPFVAGAGNPNADEGMEHFEREFTTHRIPVADGSSRVYCCRAACFGKKCAVCNWIKTKGREADQDTVKDLKGRTRHLWLVNDKPGDKKNPLKVFESNHQNKGQGFAEMMSEAMHAVSKKTDDPFSLAGGYTTMMKVKELMFGNIKYNGVVRIDLTPRDYDYPETMLEKAPCLDECLVDPGYDEVWKLLEPDDDSEDEPRSKKREEATDNEDEDESPVRGKKTAKEEYDLEDESDNDSDDDPPARKPAGKAKQAEEEDEDEQDEPPRRKGNKTPVEEDDEEDEPPVRKGRKAVIDEDDDDSDDDSDSDDDDEDDEPPVKKKRK